MKKVVFCLIVIFLLNFHFAAAQTVPRQLPPMPEQNVINSVIAQTSGVPFTPLGVPQVVMEQLGSFPQPFQQVAGMLDPNQAVSYFATDGQLLEMVIPLADSANAVLDPNMKAKGKPTLPAKIIGAVFRPNRGVMVVAAVFPEGSLRCPSCNQPTKLRFYRSNGKYTETALMRTKFTDPDKNQLADALDQGALIANTFSCVTVGLEQVCWKPVIPEKARYITRDPKAPSTASPNTRALLKAAYKQFKAVYSFQMKPHFTDAIPDLMGTSQRMACNNAFATASDFASVSACTPNVMFTGATSKTAGQPLGLFVVTQHADIKTYSATDGSDAGGLPAGSYLVMDVTPAAVPGSIGVVMLVNLDTVNHYLVPVMAMQGFGKNKKMVRPVAAIKDGFVWGKGFGY